jgi:outer membrane lipoprotein-sorting protein
MPPARGQDDARSQKIIDGLTAKFKSYPSVTVSFSATVSQLQDGSESVQDGKIWLKGSMYKLEMSDYVIYFDGSKIYQYLPDANEVNITKPDPDEDDEDFQLLNPQAFFNLSSKSFKSKLVKESEHNGRKVYELDLYPVKVKTTKYSRIRIMAEKSTMQLAGLTAYLKDGSRYALSFKPYDIQSAALRDSFFTFNAIEHPNVEVIDLTF